LEQLRALLAANCVIDGRTGEVMAGPADERKFKVYAELILKTNRNFAEETGQLPQRVEGLDQRFTQPVLGIRGRGIDYTRIAQREREWEAEAPQREAAKRERKAAVEAEMESLKRQIIASVDVDNPRAGEQRELEQWLTGEEQRRAQGLGPEDEWDQEGFAQLRRDFALVFPGDGAMAARVERFIESASRTDEQEQVKEQNMDIVRLVPPRKAAEEPEVEQVPEPEHDPYESLREAFIGALSGGYRAADDNELMLRLREAR
jgi:hypothetical protein